MKAQAMAVTPRIATPTPIPAWAPTGRRPELSNPEAGGWVSLGAQLAVVCWSNCSFFVEVEEVAGDDVEDGLSPSPSGLPGVNELLGRVEAMELEPLVPGSSVMVKYADEKALNCLALPWLEAGP